MTLEANSSQARRASSQAAGVLVSGGYPLWAELLFWLVLPMPTSACLDVEMGERVSKEPLFDSARRCALGGGIQDGWGYSPTWPGDKWDCESTVLSHFEFEGFRTALPALRLRSGQAPAGIQESKQ